MMQERKQHENICLTWGFRKEDITNFNDEQLKKLAEKILIVKEQIKTYDRYENKINRREERHTVTFYTEENYLDNKDRFCSNRRIGVNRHNPKYINIHTKGKRDKHERARVIVNEYNIDDKPGSSTYKYSPEDIYISQTRIKLIEKVFYEVWPLLTLTEKKTVGLMLKWINGHCGKCPESRGDRYCNATCTKYGMKICIGDRKYKRKGFYQFGRYIKDYEVADILGKTKSAVSKLLTRLKTRIGGKYILNQEDYDFIFEYVN